MLKRIKYDVKLMKSVVQDELEVKASGGVRSLDDMMAMIEAGASRIGTSSGVSLIQGHTTNKAY